MCLFKSSDWKYVKVNVKINSVKFYKSTSALDRANSEEIVKLINELKRDGYSVIVVTHDMQFVKN